MAIRTFIFCDICNPQGIRYVEQRRAPKGERAHGRRLTDGRAWYEGPMDEAAREGWQANPEGDRHVCPRCRERGLA